MSSDGTALTGHSTSSGQEFTDRAWQPHSSTDFYLFGNTAPGPSRPHTGPHHDNPSSLLGPGRAKSPSLTPLHAQALYSPSHVPTNEQYPSHKSPATRPTSPPCFTGIGRAPTPNQPSITFTSPPADANLVATSSLAAHSSVPTDGFGLAPSQSPPIYANHYSTSAVPDPSSPKSNSGGTSPSYGSGAPFSSSSVGRSPINLTSPHTGFFSSLRPSSPKLKDQDKRKDSSKERDRPAQTSGSTAGTRDAETKPKRPNSVFEHVGNVWERFGRKVNASRPSTSDPTMQSKRTSSMFSTVSNSTTDSSEVTGRIEDQVASPTLPNSPSLLSYLDAELTQESNPADTDTQRPSPSHTAERDSSSHTMRPSSSSGSIHMWSSGSAEHDRVSVSAAVKGEPIEYLDNFTNQARSRDVQRQVSAGAASVGSTKTSSSTHQRESSYMERVLIQVTDDNERFSVVDISGVDSADAIKERMFAKLRLFDQDHNSFQFFRTEIGQADVTGPVVNDDALLALCLQMGDDRGTLKFLVQQTSLPSQTSSRAAPSPTLAMSPQRTFRDPISSSSHLRTESQSSRSSIGDALVNPEMMSNDSNVETNRLSNSSLHRSRAAVRRALPSAPPAEELRSPVHTSPTPGVGGGGAYDRRSNASSDGPVLDRTMRPDRGEIRRAAASEMGLGQGRNSPVDKLRQMRSLSPPLPPSQNRMPHPIITHPVRNQSNPPGPSSASSSTPMPQVWSPHPHDFSRSNHSNATMAINNNNNNNNSGNHPNNVSHMHNHNVHYRPEDPSMSNPHGGHSRLRSDGQKDNIPSRTAVIMIHGTKSMDDLRKRQPPPPPPVPSPRLVPGQHHFDRDPRYPGPPLVRPASSAPQGWDGIPAQRQFSADASVSRPPPPQQDPRLLQRNRSAQAAFSSNVQQQRQQQQQQPPHQHHHQLHHQQQQQQQPTPLHGGGAMRIPPGAMHVDNRTSARSAPMPGPQPDPRFAMTRNPASAPPGTIAARPTIGPGYGHSPGPYGPPPNQTYDPRRPPPIMSSGYSNEFGVRTSVPPINPYHQNDLRLVGSMQGGYPSRPHTYHDPITFNGSSHKPPMATAPPSWTRENPFTSLYFPASSSRQVSEFQMKAGHLEPGMTVQQTLRGGRVPSQGHPNQHPPPPSFGSRDLRRPATATELHYSQPGHTQQQTNQRPIANIQSPRQQVTNSQHSHDRPNSVPHQLLPANHQTLHTFHSSVPAAHGESRPNASERSSSSSFSSSSSHRRNISIEEKNGTSSVDESFSAPTSARSSQSAPALTDQAKLPLAENRQSSDLIKQDGDLEDQDLINIRPLPKPPQTPPANLSTETTKNDSNPKEEKLDAVESRKSNQQPADEDTIQAGQWASLWKALDMGNNDAYGGTIKSQSSGDGDTLKPDESVSLATSQSSSWETAVISTQRQDEAGIKSPVVDEPPFLPPEENGTVASFASFDDDESESGTWAQPLDSDDNAPRLPLVIPKEREEEEEQHTVQPGQQPLVSPAMVDDEKVPVSTTISSPKRPELRLTIESPKSTAGTLSLNLQRRNSPNVSPLPSSSNLTSSSGGITRSNSFARRDNDWAFRPPPEQLYENLDDFFPKHDLDKPVLDAPVLPGSPLLESPRSEALVAVQALSAANPRARHKKSIRIVAQDRKRFLDRAEKRSLSTETSSIVLARRRSTRLWGTKVVEMTPGQEVVTPASAASLESPSSEASQKPVFKWVKGDLIGKGTYGRVYLALNATTGEMIAVKQVELPRTASDREDTRQKGVVAALKSEIETLKDLDHPHIVSYLGFEETTQFLSIFLEYVPGGSVGSCLRKHGKFEEATIKSFLHQILNGLAYIHGKGILHRDLKADNILVDFEGICKISDFGTVRRSDDIYSNVENMSLQGSIFWMAPEVVSLSKKGYSAKVDIWSLGCVVLEMFAGRRPWSDDEAVQAMFKIGAERKAPPIPADVTLSKKAAHFLKNCFEIDPAKRPTAQRLLDHVFSVPEDGWHFYQSALWSSLKK